MAILNKILDFLKRKGPPVTKDEDDPFVQYYIIRKSLNMSSGKMAAQCAHGAMIFMLYHEHIKNEKKKIWGPHGGWEYNQLKKTQKWIDNSFRKIILGANDSKFEKIKEELDCFAVTDAGLTEVNPGSETVLVLLPMQKSEAPKIIKRLRVV